MPTLSVTIIAHNEAHAIRQCLESVKWADEIIVLDSGSTDHTVAICKEYTDKVYVTDWPGFGLQKNRALSHATQDWILSLDADEVVTEELRFEILRILEAPKAAGYYLLRRSFFCGQLIRFGDWGNDQVLRLFKRGFGHFDEAPVHERLHVNGRCDYLKAPLLHYTADTLEEVLEKANRYSSLSARKKRTSGKKGGVLKALSHGLFAFIRSYFIKAGFLDGKAGFILAIVIAESTYYRYVKMMYC